MTPTVIALILFAITYILLFALPKYRSWIAFVSAIIFTLWLTFFCKDVKYSPIDSIKAIDFNV